MPDVHYEIIEKSKIEQQIGARYHQEIRELRAIGFEDLLFAREVTFPFSFLVFFWVYPYLAYKKEIFRIEWPLRYVLLNPILTNAEAASYCQVFGLGAKFLTCFVDGTAILTCTFATEGFVRPAAKIYKYAPSEGTISIKEAWKQHQQTVMAMEKKGIARDFELSLDKFEAVSDLDGKLTMGNEPS